MAFPEDERQKHVAALDEIERSFGEAIPEAEYQRFIRPYENRRRLAALSSSKSR